MQAVGLDGQRGASGLRVDLDRLKKTNGPLFVWERASKVQTVEFGRRPSEA